MVSGDALGWSAEAVSDLPSRRPFLTRRCAPARPLGDGDADSAALKRVESLASSAKGAVTPSAASPGLPARALAPVDCTGAAAVCRAVGAARATARERDRDREEGGSLGGVGARGEWEDEGELRAGGADRGAGGEGAESPALRPPAREARLALCDAMGDHSWTDPAATPPRWPGWSSDLALREPLPALRRGDGPAESRNAAMTSPGGQG